MRTVICPFEAAVAVVTVAAFVAAAMVALVAVEMTAVTAVIVGVEVTVAAVMEVVADPNRPPGKFICSNNEEIISNMRTEC